MSTPLATKPRPRGSTPRTRRLAQETADRNYHHGFTELAARHASFVPAPGLSPIRQSARYLAHSLDGRTPVIRDGDLLVGGLVRGPAKPAAGWIPDAYAEQVSGFAGNVPPDRPDIRDLARRGLISPQGSLNHKVVDYAGYLRTGSRALAERARRVAAERRDDPAAADFAEAFALGHEAIMRFAARHAQACRDLAAAAKPMRRRELLELARICDQVPAAPAATFHEALQALWFAYLVAGDGTGRVDVYLNDFYVADLAAGRITPKRAQELIECFLLKLHGDVMEGYVNISSVQTLTLGGVLPDGRDACNDLTRLFLRAVRAVRLLRPSVYVRCHEHTPADVLELAVELLGDGLAEPSFFGDRPVLDGLVRLGVPIAVARDYALSGCAEVVSPGRGNWGAPNGWINLALLADDALRECAATGVTTAAGMWEVIARRIDAVAEYCRVCNRWVDEQVGDTRYEATLLTPVCLDRCRDLLRGGAETYYGHWEALGLPNAADMIHAAVQLGFKAGTPLRELFAQWDAGDEPLARRLRRLPRFGNDHEAVDRGAARLVALLADALESRSTPLRRALVLGHLAGGENMHICYGRLMGPTLDGRRAGEPLADSLAGAPGQTLGGPTAVIRSLCRLDHSRLVAGNVSTLRLNPSDFRTAAARHNVVGLIRTFVALGGSQLQLNLVDPATLRAAQADPEHYAGLLVRVAGYSADFTRMGRVLQDEIIARHPGA